MGTKIPPRGLLGKHLISPETDIVLEGYPRSANTYAVVAFKLSQQSDLEIAHHYHAAAQVVRGVKWQKPTVALVRDPREAIASLCVRHPEIPVGQAIRNYIAFYRPLLRHRKRLVIGDFERVIGDFASVLVEVNERFGCNFDVPVVDDGFNEQCFAELERISRHQSGGEISEMTSSRPSEERRAPKEKIKQQMRESPLSKMIDRAQELYSEFLS